MIGLAESLPGLRRIDLTVNYRCPPTVVERAVRLVSHNDERFAKVIRAGPKAEGKLVLAADGSDETVRIRRAVASWPVDGGTRAVLSRTNAELLPAAAVAIDLGIPFRAPRLRLLTEDPRVESLLELLASDEMGPAGVSAANDLLPRLVSLSRQESGSLESFIANRTAQRALSSRSEATSNDPDKRGEEEPLPVETDELLAAMVGWAAPYQSLPAFAVAIYEHRAKVADLRRDDAQLTLATAHSTKGLEFDHVAVIGMDAGRFPSARSIREAPDPSRTLEEERRLAYVAWTRARRSLTLLYDPNTPSQFLMEAFTSQELGLEGDR